MADVSLRRELGVFGATMMGLGSIIGSGVFVSLGIAAGIASGGVILAIVAAAAVATCNALSSAQLAANHPVSGGTYEYGYRYLNSWLGFSAGWMFLCAKTASAATAALGFAGYLLNAVGQSGDWLVPLAMSTVAVLTTTVLFGVRLSNRVNVAIVSITIAALAAFVVGGAPAVSASRLQFTIEPFDLLHATALMFVAYTGYGRIATLGEEVRDPRTTIPRAIIITLVISALVYVAVGIVGVGAAGGEALTKAASDKAAPLEVVSRSFPLRVHWIVAVGAMTAMLGVLLNLVLGLSRVLLAMGRRGDMPAATANLVVAVIVTGVAIAALAAAGNVKTNWSFSAFSVLVYYVITNVAALRLNADDRLYPRWIAWIGLATCLSLAFAVEWQVWLSGLVLLAAGLTWHAVRKKLFKRAQQKRNQQRIEV
jgi:APA family basic amino acid/polyamine antiporter